MSGVIVPVFVCTSPCLNVRERTLIFLRQVDSSSTSTASLSSEDEFRISCKQIVREINLDIQATLKTEVASNSLIRSQTNIASGVSEVSSAQIKKISELLI